MSSKQEKYIATLLGVAYGDASGKAVETWPRERIVRHYGKITGPTKQIIILDSEGKIVTEDEFGKITYWAKYFDRGDYTDDTILTLPLAESLIENNRVDLEDIAKRYVHEMEIRTLPNGKITGGFGSTTRLALKNLQKGVSPLESGVIGGPGTAPCMKIAPLGLYMDAKDCYLSGLQSSEQIAKITHIDPRSVAAGVIQAGLVYRLLNNLSRDNFIGTALEICKKFEKPITREFSDWQKGSLFDRIRWIRDNPSASVKEAFDVFNNGTNVLESYPFTLFMFQKYWDNTFEGLLETVNWGGDADTNGAMFGALAGAKDGMIFPSEWSGLLEDYRRICRLGERMCELPKVNKS